MNKGKSSSLMFAQAEQEAKKYDQKYKVQTSRIWQEIKNKLAKSDRHQKLRTNKVSSRKTKYQEKESDNIKQWINRKCPAGEQNTTISTAQ